MIDFNFGNAFAHFARTGAPRGFVWRYALAYMAVQVAFIVLLVVLLGVSASNGSPGAFESGDPFAVSEAMGEAIVGALLVIVLLSLLVTAVFDAAAQRRYIRGDRFRLRLGGDEWRVFVVLLIWVGFYLAAVAVFSTAGLLFLGESGGFVSALSLFGLLLYAYLAARFSPAAALTVRDRRIRFLAAWRTTRGRRGWIVLAAYLVWALLAVVAYFVIVLFLAGVIGGAAGGPAADPGAGTLLSGGVTGLLAVVFTLLLLAASGAFFYIWAGPAALAARADGEAGERNADVFD